MAKINYSIIGVCFILISLMTFNSAYFGEPIVNAVTNFFTGEEDYTMRTSIREKRIDHIIVADNTKIVIRQNKNAAYLNIELALYNNEIDVKICTNISEQNINLRKLNEEGRLRIKDADTDQTLFHLPQQYKIVNKKTRETIRLIDYTLQKGDGNSLRQFENGDNICYEETIKRDSKKTITYNNDFKIKQRVITSGAYNE